MTDEQLELLGWVQASAPDCDSKYWIISGTTITEMNQEQKDAVDALEARQAEAAEIARGEQVASVAEAQIRTLAGLLASFGLYMPMDFAEAMGAMYAASKQDNAQTPDALLTLITYLDSKETFTDSDIYLGARHLGLTNEVEQ